MKMIINDRKYNTETAEFIGYRKAGGNMSDFHYLRESLYRKTNGEFFLSGEGGASTQWAKNIGQYDCYINARQSLYKNGNGWIYGNGIIPLTEKDARTWVEKHENAIYEDVFGPAEE